MFQNRRFSEIILIKRIFCCCLIMLYNIKCLYLHCVFHGIRFKVNNEDWLSVKMAFFLSF